MFVCVDAAETVDTRFVTADTLATRLALVRKRGIVARRRVTDSIIVLQEAQQRTSLYSTQLAKSGVPATMATVPGTLLDNATLPLTPVESAAMHAPTAATTPVGRVIARGQSTPPDAVPDQSSGVVHPTHGGTGAAVVEQQNRTSTDGTWGGGAGTVNDTVEQSRGTDGPVGSDDAVEIAKDGGTSAAPQTAAATATGRKPSPSARRPKAKTRVPRFMRGRNGSKDRTGSGLVHRRRAMSIQEGGARGSQGGSFAKSLVGAVRSRLFG